jgi:transcriptional regulator with XRE-family HTH domain
MPFDEIMLAWRRREVSSDKVLMELMPLIKGISRWAADKYNVSSMRDDIFQELCIALVGEAGEKWHPERSISSYMAGWAWRIASSMSNKSVKEFSCDSLYFDGDEEEKETEFVFNYNEDELIEEIDNQKSEKLLALISTTALDRELMYLMPKKAEKQTKATISAELILNKRLFDLRQTVGLTRPDMAEALGVSMSRYAAYETGKAKIVPEEIYASAESMVENASMRVKFSKELEQLEMKEIVLLWKKMLDTDSDEYLVKILDISYRTLKRWLYNNTKPRHSIVMTCHVKVFSAQEKKVK